MKVIENTFPEYFNVPHAEPEDLCHWEAYKCYNLVRESDDKIIFFTKPFNKNGLINGKSPKLTGVLADVKSEGFIFEIA